MSISAPFRPLRPDVTLATSAGLAFAIACSSARGLGVSRLSLVLNDDVVES